MKKLLSIICTLAIVLGVVLVPGMFSASAAGEVTVVKTSGSVTEADGVYTIASNYKDGYFFTDFKMEAGKTYNLSMNCDVSAYQNNGGVRIFATTLSDGTTNPTAASKIKALVFSKKVGTRYLRAWNFTADELLEDGFEYLAIKVNTMDAGTDYTLSDIRVVEVNNGDYLDIVGLEEQAYIYADDEGYENTLNVPWYARHYFTYDYEINPDKYYKITYEYKGKNGMDSGGATWRWQASSDKDPADATVPDKAIGVAHPEGNVVVSEYKAYQIIAKGSAFGADETHKYLTLRANNLVNPCYFRKVQVTEIEKPFFTAYGGVLNMYTDGDGVNEYGIPANDTLGAGWGADNYMTSDFVLEANSAYLVNYEWKGHNYDTPLYFAITNSPNAGFKANYKVAVNETSNKTSYSPHGVIFYTGDKVTDEYKYFGMCMRDFGGDPYLVRNLKIEKIDLANAGTLIPSGQSNNAFVQKDANGAYELYCNAWSDNGAFTFDYAIDPDKTYKLSFDFKGANRPADANGAAANKWALKTHTSTGSVGFTSGVGKIIDTIPEKDNQWGYFSYEFTFKGSDIGATAESKYLVLQQGYYLTKCYFKNIKIEEILPADYTEVDAAINAANALNKDDYKDFSGVDTAIAAVVRDKLATEQDAVDAMAKAINDAIAALEIKTADYSAVDAAIAAAEALDPSDYPNFYKVTQAIVKVNRNLGVADQATIDGYAKAINDAVAALIEDPAAAGVSYPINAGNDVKYDGETKFFHNGGYTGNSTYAFDFKLEAGKIYAITAEFAGTNKVDTSSGGFRWSAAAVKDPKTNAISRPANYVALSGVPYLPITADNTTSIVLSSVVYADDIIDAANGVEYLALVNSTHTNTYIKNIKIEEVTKDAAINYPTKIGGNTLIGWDNDMFIGNFGKNGTGYNGHGFWAIYDAEIKAGKTYTLTFDFIGHNWRDGGYDISLGAADPATASGEHLNNHAIGATKITVPSNQTTWKTLEVTFNADDVLDANQSAKKYLAIFGAGYVTTTKIRNVKLVEYVAPTDADYTAVDAAIAAANALTKANYVDFSAVDAAIAAVVRGKTVEEQAAVDAMAKAINDAIAALVKKGADYTAVNNAKAAAEALDEDLYKDFSAVDAAIAAIVTGKTIDQQAEVDAMAKAINDAVAALEFKDADYSVIDELIETIDELDGDLYKNFEDVETAIAAVVRGKNITEQGDVDAMAQAIALAYAALEYKDADYSALDALIDEAEALDAEDYTNYDAVQEILDEITDDKNITEQDEVDAWAEALEAAIDALIERADYSAFLEIVEKYEDEIGEEEEYTEESVAALKAVMDKIAANANLPADKQADVDALAEEFEAAIKALVKKPVADNNDSKVEDKVEDNKTDKTPDKTGDSSNIVVAIAALAASVIGLAVLVIGKKRRA